MNRLARPASLLLLPLLAIAAMQTRSNDDNVTIYRCTDAKGRLSIGNAPCPKGDQQEARSMLRPKDAPASAAMVIDDAPAEALPPASTPRVVVVAAPRPLYECVRPDGSVYESDDGDGEPRWVPLWTLGFPVASRGFDGRRGGSVRSSNVLSAPPSSSISIPPSNERPRPPNPPRPRPPPGGGYYDDGYGYGAGTWVRDTCNVLPQSETCARLADSRDALRRRFFNAQQRERDVLRVEERGLNARLANDCGVN